MCVLVNWVGSVGGCEWKGKEKGMSRFIIAQQLSTPNTTTHTNVKKNVKRTDALVCDVDPLPALRRRLRPQPPVVL